MQTFLPYPDFSATAKTLDWRRLGKQRVEARQIIETLIGVSSGWTNHPAVKMWRGHEVALAMYLKAIIDEWVFRGYRNSAQSVQVLDHRRVKVYFGERPGIILKTSCREPRRVMPPWLGNVSFHASHRSNLLRKDHAWYSQFGWVEPPGLPYVWPTTRINDGEGKDEDQMRPMRLGIRGRLRSRVGNR